MKKEIYIFEAGEKKGEGKGRNYENTARTRFQATKKFQHLLRLFYLTLFFAFYVFEMR